MKPKKLVSAILGGITIAAPILTLIADAISKDREIDEIADRVVLKLKAEESHVSEEKGTEEAGAGNQA